MRYNIDGVSNLLAKYNKAALAAAILQSGKKPLFCRRFSRRHFEWVNRAVVALLDVTKTELGDYIIPEEETLDKVNGRRKPTGRLQSVQFTDDISLAQLPDGGLMWITSGDGQLDPTIKKALSDLVQGAKFFRDVTTTDD